MGFWGFELRDSGVFVLLAITGVSAMAYGTGTLALQSSVIGDSWRTSSRSQPPASPSRSRGRAVTRCCNNTCNYYPSHACHQQLLFCWRNAETSVKSGYVVHLLPAYRLDIIDQTHPRATPRQAPLPEQAKQSNNLPSTALLGQDLKLMADVHRGPRSCILQTAIAP